MPRLSVIVSTYERPQDLARALEGLCRQTLDDFEVLVCDDGSGEATRALVDEVRGRAPVEVRHLWQEHRGFRAASVRNLGARAARAEALVLLDGDCVPWPDLLERHLTALEAGGFVVAERHMLEPDETAAVTLPRIASGEAFAAAPTREVRRLRRVARKAALYRLLGIKRDRPRLMTSNCALPRAALEAVNGLDERFEGWGHEDDDLRRRLVARGFTAQVAITQARCLHLWHEVDPTFLGKRKRSPNWRYVDRGFFLSRCRRGLVARPLADLAARVVGPDADDARAALGLGEARGARVEVEVLLDLDPLAPPPRPSGSAEVVVALATAADPRRARGAHLLLAPDLPVAGGELPGEAWPAVAPALARAGVKATRPVPAGRAAALAAARGILDAIL